jgi:beta-N-acetylhexosaminidase
VADVAAHDSFMRAARRTYSADPRLVGQLAAAFAQGLADEGVVATVKHFPGIGRVTRNTDRVAGTVDASAEALDEDLAPFRAAIGAGAPLVMLSNATYPAWDDANAAGWSEPVLRLLRDDLGFRGVTITDSLNGTAESRGTSAKRLASLAARAGTDLLMLTGDEASTAEAFDELLARAASGWLDEGRLRQSYDRILALKATIGP